MQEHDESTALAPDQVGTSPLLARFRCDIGRTFLANQDKGLDQVLDARRQHQAIVGFLIPVDRRNVVDEEMDWAAS